MIKIYLITLLKSKLSEYQYFKLKNFYNEIIFSFFIFFGKLKRLFFRVDLPKTEGKIFLHLGCGEINAPGFINVDAVSWPHVHYVRPIDNLSNFSDESVAFIFASHCLEHFPFNRVPFVLKEWHRVLVKGGKLCLSVPDFNLILDIYEGEGRDINTIMRPLMGGQDYRFNFHFTSFNKNNLTDLLQQADFISVSNWEPNVDDLHSVPGWASKSAYINGKEYPVSLNLEATK